MQQFFIVLCLVLMVVAGGAAVMLRSMLKSTISLGVASALLAAVLFLMGAYWAAIFELSVCSGLITVVFVSAVSLTNSDRKDEEHIKEHRARAAALPAILIFAGASLLFILFSHDFNIVISSTPASFAAFKEALWSLRQADILGQIIAILAGTFAVIVLFKERDNI